jgi:TolB-like protein/Flp pilus assembly protein TadD
VEYAAVPRCARFGTFEVDLRTGEVRKAGLKIRLQAQPFQVLARLLEHPGEMVTREELRKKLWSTDTFVDFDHGVNTAINKIRQALGDSAENPRFVETVARHGYRFIAPVEAVGAIPESPLRIQSIAVLPLENLSGSPEQEYFADGMTEALITDLGKISALRVISRTSVMRYKGTKKPLPEIARELNVDGIIEGSVVRSGDRIRITANLLHAATDRHLWAESYERGLSEILALQSEVAQAIANAIKIKLTPQEQTRLARARSVNPEAHEAYLKGRYYWSMRTQGGLKESLEYFQEAIEKDPGYALAYAGLADSYLVLAVYAVMAPREGIPRAKAAGFKALEMDETLAEAHTSLGVARWSYDWDWVGAEQEFKRAIELNPGYAIARHWYAAYLSRMGRHNEAIAEIRRAQELDPLSLAVNASGAVVFICARRYDEAVAECRRTLELNAGYYPAHVFLGVAYEQQKLYDEAISEYQKAVALDEGNPVCSGFLARGYAAVGRRTEALKILSNLRELSKRRYVSSYVIAQAYAAIGDFDQACVWLEKAYEERTFELSNLKVDPRFDCLRSDPRFQDLLRRMNFPP